MGGFNKYLKYIKYAIPQFPNEEAKQAFFLNLYNFMVLYKLAVLMISNPDAVLLLSNINMWMSFL